MNFPLIDYHVHLTEQFTIEMAVKLSGELNVKFGIVEHPGPHTGIQSDDDLKRYIENFKKISGLCWFAAGIPELVGWIFSKCFGSTRLCVNGCGYRSLGKQRVSGNLATQ